MSIDPNYSSKKTVYIQESIRDFLSESGSENAYTVQFTKIVKKRPAPEATNEAIQVFRDLVSQNQGKKLRISEIKKLFFETLRNRKTENPFSTEQLKNYVRYHCNDILEKRRYMLIEDDHADILKEIIKSNPSGSVAGSLVPLFKNRLLEEKGLESPYTDGQIGNHIYHERRLQKKKQRI